jgi:hypothetical protein
MTCRAPYNSRAAANFVGAMLALLSGNQARIRVPTQTRQRAVAMTKHVVLFFILCLLWSPTNAQSSQYKVDKSGRVIEVLNLYKVDPACTPFTVTGRVIKTHFAKDAVTVIGFVLEEKSGRRHVVEVQISDDLVSAERQGIMFGLQTLLKERRRAHAGIMACGAAGRTLMLDQIN